MVRARTYIGVNPGTFHGDIFGHEFMAEAVEAKPEVTAASIGDRVVIPFFPDTQEIKWLI